MKRPDYGIDAPGMVRNTFLAGVVALLFLVPAPFGFWPARPWNVVLVVGLLLCAGQSLGLGFLLLYSSRIGKLRNRDNLLDLVPWSGCEHVLDVGCGHGLMLVAAAKRLPNGKAIGIDLWQDVDQGNNSPEATLRNARLEGVADRIEIHTADMRKLPFPDESFDLIISHWAVHNLQQPQERGTALAEIARVLKPAGYVVLADIEHHGEYAARLTSLGFTDVRQVGASWRTAIMAIVSFGKFRPIVVVAHKSPV